jgi:hypothetical protein
METSRHESVLEGPQAEGGSAIDRGIARQGVAHTREALGETNPDALSHQSSWST